MEMSNLSGGLLEVQKIGESRDHFEENIISMMEAVMELFLEQKKLQEKKFFKK